jgi:hypothetical protein
VIGASAVIIAIFTPRLSGPLTRRRAEPGYGNMDDMAATHATRFTAKEYLALEAVAEIRHEFTD